MEAKVREESQSASHFAKYRAWLNGRWAEWRRINGISPREVMTYAHYQAFDAWLALCSARSQLDPRVAAAASSAA